MAAVDEFLRWARKNYYTKGFTKECWIEVIRDWNEEHPENLMRVRYLPRIIAKAWRYEHDKKTHGRNIQL